MSGAGDGRVPEQDDEPGRVPDHDPRGDHATSGSDAASTASGADLAREAMNRARASARQRGARQTSPRAAQRKRAEKASGSRPFGAGRDPAAMSEAVDALLRRMGWSEQIEVSGVTGRWREVVGDQIADHCQPVSFTDGALTVRASSSAWATQLTIMSGQLKHRINEEFGREIVRELTVLGPATRSWTKGSRTVRGRGPRDTYG